MDTGPVCCPAVQGNAAAGCGGNSVSVGTPLIVLFPTAGLLVWEGTSPRLAHSVGALTGPSAF